MGRDAREASPRFAPGGEQYGSEVAAPPPPGTQMGQQGCCWQMPQQGVWGTLNGTIRASGTIKACCISRVAVL
jgi:hypothetical protein